MGDVTDFPNFMGAVIDEHAFASIGRYIDGVRNRADAKILAGGGTDDTGRLVHRAHGGPGDAPGSAG